MFLMKKIIANFLFPMPIVVMLLLTGLACLWFTTKNKQRLGRILVTVSALFLIILSNDAFSNYILGYFESGVPPALFQLRNDHEPVGKYPVRYVVVLGGGHATDPGLPVTSHLYCTSLVRLVEGIRLHRYFTDSKLVLCGGSVYEKTAESETMALVAMELGVEPDKIIIENKSRDTEDQALLVKDIVDNNLFVLVTSASHMPRALALFRRQGLDPFPAPTGYIARPSRPGDPTVYFPSAGNFQKSETAIYELIGMLWAKIRGIISSI